MLLFFAILLRIASEPLFTILFPIKHLIVKPQSLEIYQEIKGARKLQSKLEEEIEEYLDDTYTLTKEINKT